MMDGRNELSMAPKNNLAVNKDPKLKTRTANKVIHPNVNINIGITLAALYLFTKSEMGKPQRTNGM